MEDGGAQADLSSIEQAGNKLLAPFQSIRQSILDFHSIRYCILFSSLSAGTRGESETQRELVAVSFLNFQSSTTIVLCVREIERERERAKEKIGPPG